MPKRRLGIKLKSKKTIASLGLKSLKRAASKEEGYIKFHLKWTNSPTRHFLGFNDLNRWRARLVKAGLVGMYPNGVGFGNLSVRALSSPQFFITGSATGGLPKLSLNDYTLVTSINFKKNSLSCTGGIKASSESLTHAAIYACQPGVFAVFHVHHTKLWKHLLSRLPSTNKSAPYGTPEMANEVFKLFKETGVAKNGIFAMGGHEEGIVAFGETMNEAGNTLLKHLAALK